MTNNTTQHTPGPWTWHDHAPWSVWAGDVQVAACRVEDDNREVVGYMERNSERAQANARLIAAAPMLLEALERLTRLYDKSLMTPVNEFAPAWAATRAAIRAAKGESNG